MNRFLFRSKSRLLLLACMLGFIAWGSSGVLMAQQAQPSRTWTDASGTYTVEATLQGVVDGKAQLLRADGRRVDVPLDKLSKADQDYVRGTMAAVPAAGSKLPFDSSLVSSEFVAAIVVQPARVIQSQTFQALSKLGPAPPPTSFAGVDLTQLEHVILLAGPPPQQPAAANADPFGNAQPPAAAPEPEKVAMIAISQKPFDRAAILASSDFENHEEGMIGGKVHLKAPEGASNTPDVVFLDDRTALLAETPFLNTVLQAQGSGKNLIAALGQLEFNHDIAMVFVAPEQAPPAGTVDPNGANPFAKVVEVAEQGMAYIDLANAPKIAISFSAHDEQVAQKSKGEIDALMGFAKLGVTQILPEQLKELPVDATPLLTLMTDTLDTFQSSAEGRTVKLSIATPNDFLERAGKCGPIIQALIGQFMMGGAGGFDGEPGPEGANPFGPGAVPPPGAAPPDGGNDNSPFGEKSPF